MSYLLLQYPKCSTCKKAQNLLKWSNLSYTTRDIAKDNPNVGELTEWIEKSNLPIEKFFNSKSFQTGVSNLQ